MLRSISISPNGWTDQELGALWMEKDFAPASAEFLDDPGDYRLLILDGHNSHCTYRFISFAQVDAYLHNYDHSYNSFHFRNIGLLSCVFPRTRHTLFNRVMWVSSVPSRPYGRPEFLK
jgi:hypothetical protein